MEDLTLLVDIELKQVPYARVSIVTGNRWRKGNNDDTKNWEKCFFSSELCLSISPILGYRFHLYSQMVEEGNLVFTGVKF